MPPRRRNSNRVAPAPRPAHHQQQPRRRAAAAGGGLWFFERETDDAFPPEFWNKNSQNDYNTERVTTSDPTGRGPFTIAWQERQLTFPSAEHLYAGFVKPLEDRFPSGESDDELSGACMHACGVMWPAVHALTWLEMHRYISHRARSHPVRELRYSPCTGARDICACGDAVRSRAEGSCQLQ